MKYLLSALQEIQQQPWPHILGASSAHSYLLSQTEMPPDILKCLLRSKLPQTEKPWAGETGGAILGLRRNSEGGY